MPCTKLHDYLWPESKRIYQLHSSLCVHWRTLHLYRTVCFLLYYIPSTIYTWFIGEKVAFYDHFFFFTDWGQWTRMAYFGFASWLGARTSIDPPPTKGFLWKFTHILFELAFSMEFIIIILFWGVLAIPYFDSVKDTPEYYDAIIKSVLLHGVTPLTVWIEFILNYVEFHWSHCIIFTPLLNLLYDATNALGVLVLGIKIYQPAIDWKSYTTAVLLIAGLVLGFVGFTIGVYVHKFKRKRFEKQQLIVYEEVNEVSGEAT